MQCARDIIAAFTKCAHFRTQISAEIGLHQQEICAKISAVKDSRSSPLERAEEMDGSFLMTFRELSNLFYLAFSVHLWYTLQ